MWPPNVENVPGKKRLASTLSQEVQDNIFSFCSSGDLARCARVCKSWSGSALDRVWYAQTGLANLFRTLAPLKLAFSPAGRPSHIKSFRFSRPIVYSDWKRFEMYAARIRSLEIPSTSDPSELLDATVLAEIVMEKPASTPVLLPNLKQLHIWGQLDFGYPWLSFFKGVIQAGLLNFGLSFSGKTYQAAADFFDEMVSRSPGLTTLHLWTSLPLFNSVVEAHMASIIRSFQELSTIHIPSCLLTPSILSSLHRHPNIRKISIIKETIRNGRTPTGRLPQSLEVGAFQKMTDLTLQCSFSELHRYLASDVVCACLEDLLIDVVFQFDAPMFRNCLAQIVDVFPVLASLVITRREDLSVIRSKTEGGASLAYQDLESLSRLKFLRNFELHHTDPISMNDDELANLLSQCPSLSNVYLNSEPIFPSATLLTVNVLPLLAKRCPQLEALSLYLDGTRDVNVSQSAELYTFENLFYIDFGTSSVSNDGDVMTLLAQVLPLDCEIGTTSAFSTDLRKALDQDVLRVMDANRAEWNKIARLLPSLIKTRIITERRLLSSGRV